jgi:hypothetical protein
MKLADGPELASTPSVMGVGEGTIIEPLHPPHPTPHQRVYIVRICVFYCGNTYSTTLIESDLRFH